MNMMKRRTLLTALPFAFIAACARAQAGQTPPAKAADMAGMPGASLAELTGGPGKVAWLNLAGSVRLTAANANVRPATLMRAIMMAADGTSARIFDIWQITGQAPVAGPSTSRADGGSETGPNDAGVDSIWLTRSFTHLALTNPIEYSRISRTGARVIAIDATQIWALEGGIGAPPSLNGSALAAFNTWQRA